MSIVIVTVEKGIVSKVYSTDDDVVEDKDANAPPRWTRAAHIGGRKLEIYWRAANMDSGIHETPERGPNIRCGLAGGPAGHRKGGFP